MKQYVITSLSTDEKYRLDTVDTDIRESLNSLKIPRIEPATDSDHWDEVLTDIMGKGYSITVEDKPELILDFARPMNSDFSKKQFLDSKEFQNVYDKNYQDYILSDLEWSEYIIDEFIEKLNQLGYTTTSSQVQFDVGNIQGRGASFDGNLDIKKFMELNFEQYSYIELINAIDNGHVEDYTNILTNSFATHYSHEKTRTMSNIEFISDEGREILDEEKINNIEAGMEAERLELCKYLMKQLDNEYENQFSKERLFDIFVDNQYKFDINGNIMLVH